MTIIAYTKGVMAADKRMSIGGVNITSTKIERMPDGALAGSSGNSAKCRVLRAWYRAGAVRADFPNNLLSDDTADMLVVERSGRILLWTTDAEPIEIHDSYAALGAQLAAHALMSVSFSAYDTVEIICRVSQDCGNGIDKLELHPAVPQRPEPVEHFRQVADRYSFA